MTSMASTKTIGLILKRSHEAHRAGLLSEVDLERTKERAASLRQRVIARKKAVEAKRQQEAKMAHRRRLVPYRARRDLMHIHDAQGATFVAFDVELVHRDDQTITEVGLTIARSGEITSEHYVVEEQAHRIADPVPFLFGKTETLPHDAIMDRVRAVAAAADHYVFHAHMVEGHLLPLDLKALRWFDTAHMGRIFVPDLRNPSLESLCLRYGIDISGWHNAGNDSRYTYLTMRAMADSPDYHALVGFDPDNPPRDEEPPVGP